MELTVFCEREISIYPRCDGKPRERLLCQIDQAGEASLRSWHLSWALKDWTVFTRVKWVSVQLELLKGKRELERKERERERELPHVVSSCLVTWGIRKKLNLSLVYWRRKSCSQLGDILNASRSLLNADSLLLLARSKKIKQNNIYLWNPSLKWSLFPL